jgi:tetratricopeptide (TPR) repeat protein
VVEIVFNQYAAIMNYASTFALSPHSARNLQSSREISASFHGLFAISVAVLLIFALGLPLGAQEGKWRELVKQANELRGEGKYGEAIPVAEEAVRVAEKTFGGNHPAVVISLNLLGAIYDDEGKYAEAEPLFKRGLAIREKALGPRGALGARREATWYQFATLSFEKLGELAEFGEIQV